MALDSNTTPSLIQVFDQVNSYMGEIEFNEDIYVYPIGIADIKFERLDEEEALKNGWIDKINEQYFDKSNSDLAYSTHNAKLIAPLFDLYSSDIMGVVFKPDFFYSNYRAIDEISTIELTHQNHTYRLNFDEIFEFRPSLSLYQEFKFKITYADGKEIVNHSKIYTPELAVRKEMNKSSTSFPKCTDKNDFTDNDGNKLQYCFINSCLNSTTKYSPKKPYVLVTGYRPPFIGQSFKKTWRLYSEEHKHLLFDLLLNDFDVILVRFNIQWKPYQHGMQESADLFIRFINDLNLRKTDGRYHENIIQGSSMGADIVRLALLKMEKKHFEDNTYPHHHSRLFLAYDANFFGANIPLAYQYQIYSGFLYPTLNNVLGPVNVFLKTFLFATMEQKTVKELLMYHAKASASDLFFYPTHHFYSWKPTFHSNRQGYYDALNIYDNKEFIFPLQSSTRNIAISLGKISGTNDQVTNLSFNQAGEYWRNQNLVLYKSKLRTGKYSSNSSEILFKRKRINLIPFPFVLVDHEVNVIEMQEIDNAPGSYLRGAGNIISVTDWAHFTLHNIVNGKNFFTHKPTFTALGINPDLWPSNGSHTLDMQGLNLMFNEFNFNPNNPSNYFGYPNLGRPNDHFDVTPFEAVYVGTNIHPHIVLGESDEVDVSAINDFILNEVEPWYLGLQNEEVGGQARANYTYRAHRRAKYNITTGYLVTPKTDPGDYIVKPNADLRLEAGESIHLKPGTHLQIGVNAHIFINYDACSGSRSSYGNENDTPTTKVFQSNQIIEEIQDVSQNKLDYIQIYPNPSRNQFTVASMQDVPIESIRVYSLNGTIVHSENKINVARYICEHKLDQGTYFVVISCVNGSIHRKKVVVL
jgi:hypothetical protein